MKLDIDKLKDSFNKFAEKIREGKDLDEGIILDKFIIKINLYKENSLNFASYFETDKKRNKVIHHLEELENLKI